jgi:hypothetical protein|tara:strand:- start:227 stop:1285 length:1059 start_codon:yes stop_codon:yes gene_type:complete
MHIKITYHLMPWEIDYALLTFTQLKKSLYYLTNDVEVTIDSVLNLSSNIIDWDKSELPKEYFIEKYNTYSLLLDRGYTHNKRIYDGDKLYGHLDLQRECIGEEFTHYMNICPDLYFSETALTTLIQTIPIIKENYDQFPHFIIVPEIFQMWDDTWQEIVGSEYKDVPNNEWYTSDIFDIRASKKYRERMALIKDPSEKDVVELRVVKKFLKWTGWFDLYSKDLYEKIITPPKKWKGYGPWDLFSMNVVADLFNDHNFAFLEFVVSEKIGKYSTGPLNQKKGPHTGNWIQPSIKKFLHIKENNSKEDQRQRMGKDGDPLKQMRNSDDSIIKKRIKSLQKDKKLWKSISINKKH